MVRFLLPDLDFKAVLEEPEAKLTDAADDVTKHLWDRRRGFSDHPATNNRKKKQKKKRKISFESQDIILKEEVFFFLLTDIFKNVRFKEFSTICQRFYKKKFKHCQRCLLISEVFLQ